MTPDERQRRIVSLSKSLARAEQEAERIRHEIAALLGLTETAVEDVSCPLREGSIGARILSAVREIGRPAVVPEIFARLSGVNPGSVGITMRRLVRAGHLTNPSRGLYGLPEAQ